MNWMQGMAVGFILGAVFVTHVHPWIWNKINGRRKP